MCIVLGHLVVRIVQSTVLLDGHLSSHGPEEPMGIGQTSHLDRRDEETDHRRSRRTVPRRCIHHRPVPAGGPVGCARGDVRALQAEGNVLQDADHQCESIGGGQSGCLTGILCLSYV